MTGRPEALFPLFEAITKLAGVGPKTAEALARLGITRPRDLLFTVPGAAVDRRLKPSIMGLPPASVATVEVAIGEHLPPRVAGRPYRVFVEDAQTSFQLVFFHAREDWLRRSLPEGERRIVSGKVEIFDGTAQMVHPDHILNRAEAEALPPIEPVYPLGQGVTQRVMVKATSEVLERVPDLGEWIEPSIFAREGWPDLREALHVVHRPRDLGTLSPDAPPRRRLAYDELLSHQLTLQLARAKARRAKGRVTEGDGRLSAQVEAALPYALTGAQTRALAEIRGDLALPQRMNRLLQGDVGSGKTVVALLAMLTAVEAGGQAALMAPTEILVQQHRESLAPFVELLGLRMEVFTGRDTAAQKAEKRAALAAGDIALAVGTHALFQEGVEFADLRLAIVDEQHRFGVRQRMGLSSKGVAADLLVMTATPIPRSLTLAQYGDMDLSVLDEKPPGRKPIETVTIPSGRYEQVVDRLAGAIRAGKQAYWVCPLVAESEVLTLTAAEERFKALRARLGDQAVGLVHGQMPGAEKDAAMARFVAGETSLLVATTVIEVGVNVPNASIMVIEGAEHFGLSQLHQLRGRVGRGTEASTCLLLYDGPVGESARRRLEIMRETEDGFRIAEEDLALRGAGDVIGTAQSGLPRFRIADLERQADLMAMARDDARLALERDPELTSERGHALRALLWLMGRDEAIRLIGVG
ncbi:MAG: ATP-dependent DNA helicase RecG [Pseudomonadota bacterium]